MITAARVWCFRSWFPDLSEDLRERLGQPPFLAREYSIMSHRDMPASRVARASVSVPSPYCCAQYSSFHSRTALASSRRAILERSVCSITSMSSRSRTNSKGSRAPSIWPLFKFFVSRMVLRIPMTVAGDRPALLGRTAVSTRGQRTTQLIVPWWTAWSGNNCQLGVLPVASSPPRTRHRSHRPGPCWFPSHGIL